MSDHEFFSLPSSSSSLSEDRYSILDSDDALVPTWTLLSAILSEPITSPSILVEKLETIAICISSTSTPDYGFLNDFILSSRPLFFKNTWPSLAKLALSMPELFPSGRLPILTPLNKQLVLSRRQVACLIIHQFLSTLRAPPWQTGFRSFHIWYQAAQPHPRATTAYLTALFTYFDRLLQPPSPLDANPSTWPIKYTLHTATAPPPGTPLTPIQAIRLPDASTSPSLLGLPTGACVISANKFIGFGRSGTQEETHVGASPEACAAVLVTPPLEDDRVLAIEGAEAMVVVAGYGRSARCAGILGPDEDAEVHRARWCGRTMLFMDALELDGAGAEGLADLRPGNVGREVVKAYTAFSARTGERFEAVYTGFWGCGAFGGNPDVKTMAQWIAASMAGVELRFVCAGAEQGRFADDLEKFVQEVGRRGVGADDLERSLTGMRPDLAGYGRAFEGVLAALD